MSATRPYNGKPFKRLTTHQATIIAKAMWEKQQNLYPQTPWENVGPQTKANAIGCARVAVKTYLALEPRKEK